MQYIYTMEYYSAIKRNKTGSFVAMWMNLESVIQSKEKRKETNKYCILTYIYGIQRYDTDEQNRNLQGRNTDTDKENGHTGVMGERKGGKNWKSGTDIYIYTTMCEIHSQWEAAVEHRLLSLMLCDDLEWGVVGREAQEGGDICIRIADSFYCTVKTGTTL